MSRLASDPFRREGGRDRRAVDQAADDVLFNIVFSCDDPGDMFAIIVSIKQVATGVCSITLSLCLSVSLSLFLSPSRSL